jgi:hypothetical protein
MLLGLARPSDATREAELALSEGEWKNEIEMRDAYVILAAILKAAGRDGTAADLAAEVERIDHERGSTSSGVAHDHDGDGVADH